ncbi:hypothetical protein IWW56_005222 [Coemansia sp. RSA 2131]|nr:hypothetical protein IWW56_005222 [Coemansia sp. RSA 2131]
MARDQVYKFKDEQSFRNFITNNEFVVVNFTSTESRESIEINSTFSNLSWEHPKVKFVQVVDEEAPMIFRAWEVSGIPSFMFFYNKDNKECVDCYGSDNLAIKVRMFSKQAEEAQAKKDKEAKEAKQAREASFAVQALQYNHGLW